jgi:hypothetical protein
LVRFAQKQVNESISEFLLFAVLHSSRGLVESDITLVADSGVTLMKVMHSLGKLIVYGSRTYLKDIYNKLSLSLESSFPKLYGRRSLQKVLKLS